MEIGAFIDKWRGVTGGQERANYGQFINDFCQALHLPLPQPASAGVLGDYQFEGPVQGGGAGGNTGAIDLYKKGHFILEAKQSKLTDAQKQQAELFDAAEDAPVSPSGARYDRLMRDALAQAKRYAVNLPPSHPWPPFLIVCDVGRAFELYFDYSGNGRGYGYFPDQHSYRFEITRFTDDDVQAIFRSIWTDPASIDPRAKSALVSRGIASRLAAVSKWLEETQRQKTTDAPDFARSMAIEETALFLMRIVFCMFAEDVSLIPKGSFTAFLEKAKDNDAAFEPELRQLWQVMARDGGERYTFALGADVRFFNGGLFASAQTYRLSNADIGELYEAAKADWTKVEPAIFGTLLEQALTASERSKLGAHYTPRPYVERLVQATIMDVLEAEWEAILKSSPSTCDGEGDHPPKPLRRRMVEGTATSKAPPSSKANASAATSPSQVDGEELVESLSAFHHRLSTLRILDPACGTGNFLYVAMENVMRLEGDVIETIRQLGGTADPLVGPQQFLGLELNPRAAVIAELVLWIGWLRWRMKNDPDAAPDPVLKQYGNINFGGHAGYDAVLCHTPTGEADTETPMMPDWPEADFIIGNPPFIGGKDIRRQLGGDYAEALWKANTRVPKSADFVMQWWDRAAHILVAENTPLIRFGFVTTNSITQTFSRRVIEGYLHKKPSPPAGEGGAAIAAGGEGVKPQAPRETTPSPTAPSEQARKASYPLPQGERGLSLILAIPDHPWTKATKDAAAVRIAMTVAERGQHDGRLVEIVREAELASDSPKLVTSETEGSINADLSLGADVTQTEKLLANTGICHDGVKLHGQGFSISRSEAEVLGLGRRENIESFIRSYRNGKDLTGRAPNDVRNKMVIDLFGLDEKTVMRRYPEVAQHLLSTVKATRETQVKKSATSDAKAYLATWWLMGKPRPELRTALAGLNRYIATVDTSKHRIFQFLESEVICDDKVVIVAADGHFELGVLSSWVHVAWSLQLGGWMGVGNDSVYVKTRVFDPFPFPDASPEQRATIAELAEELDETRKAALAEVPGLTMTEIYNLRAKLSAGAAMDFAEQDRATKARAGIVNRLHEQIDAAVADAYGWADDYHRGDLTPSEIVTRLVALNAQRAQEEAQGKIRWLRPDYQIPRFAAKKPAPK